MISRKYCAIALVLAVFLTACGRPQTQEHASEAARLTTAASADETAVAPSTEIKKLEDDLFTVRYDGAYGLAELMQAGGASADQEVAAYLAGMFASGLDFDYVGQPFGCSTILASTGRGAFLFGRNFDWQRCRAMVVETHPPDGYASLSTVNLDFIGSRLGDTDTGELLALAAVYAPLDGMNERGLAVSVNMIQDAATISQNTDKPDVTTTLAIRLLLDHAANVAEALELLSEYDMHAPMGMMVHFALADDTGKSVAVEYVDDQMIVTDTPVLTNFYIAPGDKNGIGTRQSHERYEILTEILDQQDALDAAGVRDALSAVGKSNFAGAESTEWSVVFHLNEKKATLYHRENFDQCYAFTL